LTSLEAAGPIGWPEGHMADYLITYDLHDRSREDDLLAYLKRKGAKLVTASSYKMTSGRSAEDIVERVKKITKRITIYVFKLRSSDEHHAEFRGK
jgi:CRISPR/Cas system-associated endoribonuclease Cas2